MLAQSIKLENYWNNLKNSYSINKLTLSLINIGCTMFPKKLMICMKTSIMYKILITLLYYVHCGNYTQTVYRKVMYHFFLEGFNISKNPPKNVYE